MGKTLNLVPVTALDYRRLAEARLPRFLFDYVDGGAGDEATLAANVQGFATIRLRQRVLVDVSQVDTRTRLAGQDCTLPLALAPVGLAGMMARRGEAQAARAAQAAGVPFTLSTVGICPLSEVVAATGAAPWFRRCAGAWPVRPRSARARRRDNGSWGLGTRGRNGRAGRAVWTRPPNLA